MKLRTVMIALVLVSSVASFNYHTSYARQNYIANPDGKWHTYTSEDGKMSINFPTEPETDVTEGEDITTYKISASLENTTFFAGYTIHKNSLENEDLKELAKISLDAFTDAVKGEITSQKPYKYKKHEGIEADIKMEGAFIKYKVVLIDQAQYQLVVISMDGNFGSDADEFFNSLKVK